MLAVSSSLGSLAHTNSYFMLVVVFVASALTVAIVRPYKRNIHSILDSLLLVAVALFSFLIIKGIIELVFTSSLPSWFFPITTIVLIIPLLITGAWLCYVLIERKHFMFCWKKLKLSHYLPGPTHAAREQDIELPDRLNDPTVCDSDYHSF